MVALIISKWRIMLNLSASYRNFAGFYYEVNFKEFSDNNLRKNQNRFHKFWNQIGPFLEFLKKNLGQKDK